MGELGWTRLTDDSAFASYYSHIISLKWSILLFSYTFTEYDMLPGFCVVMHRDVLFCYFFLYKLALLGDRCALTVVKTLTRSKYVL